MGAKPKQVTISSTNQLDKKGQVDPKRMITARVIRQRSLSRLQARRRKLELKVVFFGHIKGHRKQDYTKWKAKQMAMLVVRFFTSAVTPTTSTTIPIARVFTGAISHTPQKPSWHSLVVHMKDKQKGAPILLEWLCAYGSSQAHKVLSFVRYKQLGGFHLFVVGYSLVVHTQFNAVGGQWIHS